MDTYIWTEERDGVAVVLALGDVVHLLHGLAVGQNVPLAPALLVTEVVEHPLRRRAG